jgi:hypothetical protein
VFTNDRLEKKCIERTWRNMIFAEFRLHSRCSELLLKASKMEKYIDDRRFVCSVNLQLMLSAHTHHLHGFTSYNDTFEFLCPGASPCLLFITSSMCNFLLTSHDASTILNTLLPTPQHIYCVTRSISSCLVLAS